MSDINGNGNKIQDKLFTFFAQHGVPSIIAMAVLYEMHLFFIKITEDLATMKTLIAQLVALHIR